MKKLKFIFQALFCLILFSVVGAFASTVDVGAFIDAPLIYLIDHASSADVLYAAFPFYGAVDWTSGEDNMPGTRKDVYFVPLDGISTFPDLPTSKTEDEDYHTLDGSLVLAANCNVIKLYTTYGTENYKAEIQGETDGKYFKLTGEFFHPGTKAAIINFASACPNTPGILFIPMEDFYLVLGSLHHPVYLSPSFDTGKVGEGKKGTTFMAEAWGQRIITKYEGDLPLSPTSS